MLNILIISDGAKDIYALFKAGGFAPDTRNSEDENSLWLARSTDPGRYDIAFLDLDTRDWEAKLMDLRHHMPVIAFSRPDIGKVVQAMKLGASDFLEVPLSGDVLNETLSRYKKKLLNHKYGFDEIIGISSPMQEVFGLIKKAGLSESNVLITGESGTGKELVARAIHRWSPRSDKSFMTINCSAIPDTLLESELFGFEKGAFTGANFAKMGLLELADNGTVFFDEIGDVSPLFQTKILRVLQEGEIMKIGGMRQTRVDLRIIAATNKNLKTEITKGAFREDLFYRLDVINIHLPPLRERLEDIPQLAGHLVKKHSTKRKDMLIKGIHEDAMNVLMGYSFPGNVRELENVIERAISFASSPQIFLSDLPSYLKQSTPERDSGSPKLKDVLRIAEREAIVSALIESGGNISKASTALGIYRQQLQRKIKQLKIAT